MNFKIEKLDLSNDFTVRKFKDFYYKVFIKCFPKDEIGEFEDYIRLKQDENEDYTYHLSFADVGFSIYAACFIYCVFPKLKMMVGEFACVDEQYRRKGLASALMHDAISSHDCKWIFGEIEKDNAFNLSTWRKYGFKKIPINYVQIALGNGRAAVDNLYLCAMPLDSQSSIQSNDLKNLVYHYYRWSQLYSDPSGTSEYNSICEQCDKQAVFQLEDI